MQTPPTYLESVVASGGSPEECLACAVMEMTPEQRQDFLCMTIAFGLIGLAIIGSVLLLFASRSGAA